MNGVVSTIRRSRRRHAWWLTLLVLLGMLAQSVHAASHDEVADPESCVECLLVTSQQPVPPDFIVARPAAVAIFSCPTPVVEAYMPCAVGVPHLRGPPEVSVV